MNNSYSPHTAMQAQTHVEVLFYEPQQGIRNTGDCINMLAVWWDSPFCHTEMKFPNEQTVRIVKHGCVELVHRSFDPKVYTGLKIKTTCDKAKTACDIATELSKRQVPFGLTTRRGSQTECTYCAKAVLDVLWEAGIISSDMISSERYFESSYVSPSALHRNLLNDPEMKVAVFTPKLTTPCVSFLDFSNDYQAILLICFFCTNKSNHAVASTRQTRLACF